MSILNTSVSGMLANTNWLTTIAHNVANANTVGFKTVETSFSALVNSAVDINSEYSGVTAATRSLNSLQGQNMQTNSTTDLSVQGAGFFIVADPTGDILLTRNGSFVPDAAGDLVNSSGMYLMGAPYAQTGVAINSLSGLGRVNVNNVSDTSIPSTAATVTANLPATSTVVTGATPAANTASSQYTAESSLVAYDNLGASHTLNIYYTNKGGGTWEATVFDAATAATGGGFPYSTGPLTTQTLTFSPTDGKLVTGSPLTATVPTGQSLTIDVSHTTQLASGFAVSSVTVNGNPPSSVTDVNVAEDGTLYFNYGSGNSNPIYKIPLAKVASPDNLKSVNGGAYQTNIMSGAAQVGVAGTAGFGVIQASSLEQSTVDLATELTQMVQAQSSYEANSKVFQAGAKILDVLNNIQA